MDRSIERELKLIKSDSESINGSLISNQVTYANMLKNGFGEKIKEELSVEKKNKFSFKLKRIIRKILNTI